MLASHVLPYIEQRARELGATGFHWEPEIVRVLLPDDTVKELAANQRLYVVLPDHMVDYGKSQLIGMLDLDFITIKSSTAEMRYARNASLPQGGNVAYMNGVEHSGSVAFNYADKDNLPNYGISVYVIVATYYFDPQPPCLPFTNC